MRRYALELDPLSPRPLAARFEALGSLQGEMLTLKPVVPSHWMLENAMVTAGADLDNLKLDALSFEQLDQGETLSASYVLRHMLITGSCREGDGDDGGKDGGKRGGTASGTGGRQGGRKGGREGGGPRRVARTHQGGGHGGAASADPCAGLRVRLALASKRGAPSNATSAPTNAKMGSAVASSALASDETLVMGWAGGDGLSGSGGFGGSSGGGSSGGFDGSSAATSYLQLKVSPGLWLLELLTPGVELQANIYRYI